jgi:tetratricopeptide (TPR) repeat protein
MAEKTLDALPRDVRALYTRGHDAFQRENYDYAIDLFNQVLAREPAVFDCRKELRLAQLKKAGSGGGLFKRVWNSASASPMVAKAQLALRKDPGEAMRSAEQILNSDPNNSQAHRILVEAAKVLDLPRTAVMSLEFLHRNSPKDKQVGMDYAQALADAGEVQRSENVLAELCRAFPTDSDIAQARKNASARTTMDEGGYDALADGKGSYRDILKDKEEAISLEQQNRQVKTEDVSDRLIREYEARLPQEPGNLKLLRSLAELYTQKKQFDTALGYYEKIKSSDLGADASLDRAMGDTILKRFDHQVAELDPTAPDYADRVAVVTAEKQAFQLAECRKRVERYPTDLQFRFELGQLLFQNGKISDAIQELQKAQANPNRRIAAMNYLAQCFAARKMFDLAARTLQNAIKEKPVFDDEKKELVYNLGVVLENMGKREEAVEQFKLIYESDIGYKDVAAKVDAYYAGQ